MLFHPHILEDLSDEDNDFGEDEEEDDDGGDSDFDAKEASRGRPATAKRKRAAGITNINTEWLLHSLHKVISDTIDGVSYFLCTFDLQPCKCSYILGSLLNFKYII